MHSRKHDRQSILLIVALLSLPGLLQAQVANSPRLASVFPPGAKSGTDCEVTVTGDGLEGDQQLLFSNPAITAEPIVLPADRFYPTTRPALNHFKVHVGANVPAGEYQVRIASPLGISNSRTFEVGQLPELAETKPGRDPAAATQINVNSVTSGAFAPQATDYYRFSATRGQHLVLHCAAKSIESRAEPRFALYDSAGTLLRQVRDPVRIDPTCSFTVPADGEYVLAIHDFVFAGGADYGYRLSISTGPWIDYVDSPFVTAGGEKHALYGRNLPGSSTADVTINGDPLERLEVTIKPPADRSPAVDTFIQPAEGGIDTFSYRFTGATGTSNPVRMALADGPFTAEVEPNDKPEQAQSVSPPVQVVGRFNPRNDRDWYSFHARKGEKFWIEVTSQRLGLPTDPRLTVQQVATDKSGKTTVKEIAEVDDPRNDDAGAQARYRVVDADPALAFTAPDDGVYRVLVQDVYSSAQGAPWYFYLLNIRPAHPDFRLIAYPSPLNPNEQSTPLATLAHKGSGKAIEVVALRRDGFNGAIELTADGLPPGVSIRPGCVAPGLSVGALFLQVAADAPDWAGSIRIIGKPVPPLAGDDVTPGQTVADASSVHVAQPAETVYANVNGGQVVPVRLTTNYGLAIRGGLSLPFSIDIGESKVWRVPRGGTLQIPVKLARNAQFVRKENNDDRDYGEIRLEATSQGQVRAEGVPFDAGTSEKDLKVDIDPSATAGSYAVMLHTEVSASLSPPDVGKQAAVDLKRIDAIDKDAAQSAQKAAQEHQRAEEAVPQANGLLAQAQQQQAAAKAADEAAHAKLKEVAQQVKQLEQADAAAQVTSSAPTPAQTDAAARSKAALAEGRRQADDAAAKAKEADAALEKSASALADAQQKVKLAEESRKTAIAADLKAKDDMKDADEARRVAEERARKLVDNSRPREVRMQISSPPIRIDVVPAPFALKVGEPAAPIQAGGKSLELPVSIAPDFGFADAVKFELVSPSGISGIALLDKQNAIARTQTQSTLAMQADKSATVGSFTVTLRAHYLFNNRDLTLDRRIAVQVTPPSPAAK